MTWANLKSTGRGRIRAGLAFAGLPYVFVSNAQMIQTAADGRIWALGLDTNTLKWSVNADLARASLNVEGFTATIKDLGGKATAAFGRRPSQSTAINATVEAADTTINVFDTSGFPSAGVGHIATEAFSYSGKTSTSFTGCTRGIWGTVAQYHYIADLGGAEVRYPKVTDWPVGLEGRPITLALYGDGDSGTGAGTDVFRGVCNRGARFSQGVWTVGIDPVTRILDQNVGGDVSEPVPIRGIHYTPVLPFRFAISTPTQAAPIAIVGFFEDEASFCDRLTADIATATAGFTWAAGSSIEAAAAFDGIVFTYTVGPAGTAPAVVLSGLGSSGVVWLGADGTPTAVFVLGGIYTTHLATQVPRATVGIPGTEDIVIVDGTATGEAYRIYLGGDIVPSTEMLAVLESPDSDEGTPAEVTSVDLPHRSMVVDCTFRALGPSTQIRIGRVLASGVTVNGLRTALVADSPQFCNAGAMPLVTAADIASSPEVDAAAIENAPVGYGRTFAAFDSMTLGEIVEPELRALGCYQRVGSGGALEWKRLRPTVATDEIDFTIVEADIIGWPTTERGQYGITDEVVYKTGWDAKENEHLGQVYRFRDVGASSPNRVSQVLEIAQLSLARSRFTLGGDLTIENVRTAAMPVLGLFGVEYDVIQLAVGMRFFEAKIGDAVLLTSSKVPSIDGARGVTDEVVMITGTAFDLSTGQIQLSLLRHGQRFAGYAPSFRMDPGDASLVSGTTYDLVLQMSDYTDASSLSRWLTVGDLLVVREDDTLTPTSHDVTVVSFPAVDTVRLLFAGAFTMGASEWSVEPRDTTAYAGTDDLARFMFVANTARRIPFSDGDVDARVYAP